MTGAFALDVGLFARRELSPSRSKKIDIQVSLLGKMLRHKTQLGFVCSPGVTLRSSDDVFIDRLDQLTVRSGAQLIRNAHTCTSMDGVRMARSISI